MIQQIYVFLAFLMVTYAIEKADDAIKNHKIEKRQDDFLLYGGWRPVRTRNSHYQTSASSPYHDILSALPTSFDSAAGFYSHALPSRYHKDIYSYYPKPAIKSKPKKNTPVYMETFRPQQKYQQQQGYDGGPNNVPQLLNLHGIDIKQIRELQNILSNVKNLPIPQIGFPIETGKPLEILEVALQTMQPVNGQYNNGDYGVKARHSQRGNKASYIQPPPHKIRLPVPQPGQFEYVNFPKGPEISQVIPKGIEISPLNIQHPALEDLIDLKNIQIVEVPVPSPITYEAPRKGGASSNYGVLPGRQQKSQYASNMPQKSGYSFSYFTHQSQQPQQHYPPHSQKPKHIPNMQDIEAELVKLSEEDLKGLLSKLQILDKAPHDLLKYFSVDSSPKIKENNVLIVALPEAHSSQHYSPQKSNGAYGNEGTQPVSYSPKDTNINTAGGYHGNRQEIEQNQDYIVDGYNTANKIPQSVGGRYAHSKYQNHESHVGYEQQVSYHTESHQGGDAYQSVTVPHTSPKKEHSEDKHGHKYIQVVTDQVDENGYRREPVLAVEIQHGQTVEEALKSLDPETLQKIGIHGEHGIEIEVVEVPVDDYVSESKKVETVVKPSRNSTVIHVKAKKSAAKTTKKS